MLWAPIKGMTRYQSNIAAAGSSTLGTSCTTGAAEATKGTIVEAISSTNFDSYLMHITIGDYTAEGSAGRGCLDIMIGGSGSEVALIENLLMGYCGGSADDAQVKGPKQWMFPVFVPAGSRLSIRAAGEAASTTVRCAITLMGGQGSPQFHVGTKVTTYGVATVANGTTITEGQSGVEGAWAQITSSTSRDHFCVVPSFQFNTQTTNEAYSYVDLGIGAASSEVQIGAPYVYSSGFYALMDGPFNPMPTFCNIPAGTRLAMRASNSGLRRAAQGAIHGVT